MSDTTESTTGATEQVETNVEEVAQEEVTKRPRTSMEAFIEAWEETVVALKDGTLTGSGVQIVADRLGLKKASVSQRATKFRQEHGVPLSKMPKGGGNRFDTNKANATLEAIQARLAKQLENTES